MEAQMKRGFLEACVLAAISGEERDTRSSGF